MASDPARDDAQLSLDELTRVRAAMTTRVLAPWWYRWGMALCTGAIFAGIGLFDDNSTMSSLLVVAGAIIGPTALAGLLKQTTGVLVDRYSGGMLLWYLVVFGVLLVGLAVQVWLDLPYVLFAGAAVGFVATLLLERHIDRRLAGRLGAGGAA